MATRAGLVRSFYGWFARTERALRESGLVEAADALPPHRPTPIPSAHRVAQKALEALAGTPHEDKARYWADLLGGIVENGWTGESRTVDTDRARIRGDLEESFG
jgi:hypothetical protein